MNFAAIASTAGITSAAFGVIAKAMTFMRDRRVMRREDIAALIEASRKGDDQSLIEICFTLQRMTGVFFTKIAARVFIGDLRSQETPTVWLKKTLEILALMSKNLARNAPIRYLRKVWVAQAVLSVLSLLAFLVCAAALLGFGYLAVNSARVGYWQWAILLALVGVVGAAYNFWCARMVWRQRQYVKETKNMIDRYMNKQSDSMDGAIDSAAAPSPVGHYPHARRLGRLLFLSGVGPRKPGTKDIPGVTFDESGGVRAYDVAVQARSVFENVEAVLKAAGLGMGDLVDVTVFLTDMARDFKTFNAEWAARFPENPPCRTTVEVGALPTPIAVELKCIAAYPEA